MTVRVQEADFDPGAEMQALTAGCGNVGGLCSFIGLVRNDGATGRVAALTLEHYPGMTERKLAALEAEARARWALDAVLIIHRYGRLEVGDRIVMTAVASAHRRAAFEACAFLMDRLKTEAPFWKSEETPDGATGWVESRREDAEAAARWRNAADNNEQNNGDV